MPQELQTPKSANRPTTATKKKPSKSANYKKRKLPTENKSDSLTKYATSFASSMSSKSNASLKLK